MTRTATRKPTRKREYSDAERAERARLDTELLDRANGRLAGDPDFIRGFVASAVDGMSPRILGYSLRNQALLADQASERGITLRDVDTFRGWRNRGRGVRKGEHGLRIIAPVGLDDAKGNKDQEETHDGPTDDEAPRVRFRVMTVFEISQTDTGEDSPADQDCPVCGADAGEPCNPGCCCSGCVESDEPGEILWNNMCEQITRAGYRVEWPGDDDALSGARVHVDHAARVLHIAMTVTPVAKDVLADIATALAEIITRTSRTKPLALSTAR